ncbi:MAG: hypothetical protein F6K49_05965 [Moorea sp. SIO3I6]|uniref:hypothetical protein n=1 Tax=Moorena sp. SIO4A5 TaxID=2607838 RepID=UPI0013C6CB04|nr:hypothetical protein [Moorena sp. SIO4A5]NEO18185.1 hypothetical protein [Moorena sp. SIO4A5]NEP21580.1 hypothetical protein [Moorena sp. SIO3I6]
MKLDKHQRNYACVNCRWGSGSQVVFEHLKPLGRLRSSYYIFTITTKSGMGRLHFYYSQWDLNEV